MEFSIPIPEISREDKKEAKKTSSGLGKNEAVIFDLIQQVAELRAEVRTLRDLKASREEAQELREEAQELREEAQELREEVQGLRNEARHLKTNIDVLREQIPTEDAIKAYTFQLKEVQDWMITLTRTVGKSFADIKDRFAEFSDRMKIVEGFVANFRSLIQ